MSQENKTYFITGSDFEKLLNTLGKKGNVYIPGEVINRHGISNFPYEKLADTESYTFRGYRPTDPLKTFLFSGRTKVAEYPADSEEVPGIPSEPVTIVGASACDIESLKSLDAVFLQDEFTDIFYQDRRNNSFIISADCENPRENCLCTLAGNYPYAKEGFDLNLSSAENGFIIEVGSDKGAETVSKNSTYFAEVPGELFDERNKKRAVITEKVKKLNSGYTLSKSRSELLRTQRESEGWFEHVSTCIGCGACLFSCPTCHCFLLYDQDGTSGKYNRIKEWDACSYAGYSKMAGGSTPRLGLMERFRHRYLHKFEYFPKNFGFEACSGCGRCIDGCMGKIDMRKVLKALDSSTVGAK
ncbi:4Fe-4S dicluster domain-containing protein [Candidatus Latescibacterota bacterium]